MSRLTDFQLDKLYLSPAMERLRRLEDGGAGGAETFDQRGGGFSQARTGNTVRTSVGSDAEVTRSSFIRDAMAMFGGTPAKWGAEYDRQVANATPKRN